MSSALFDRGDQSRAHLILDGTYIFIDKSTNYLVQKQTFNSHKKRNYVKMMMGVATNGKIILASGPFKATENDAEITKTPFNRRPSPSLKNHQAGDIMIVDRGFRDCADSLRSQGFIVKMPTCSTNPQLSSDEANSTRFVTIIRYNVERVNGVMKAKWKIFATQIDTRLIPHIATDFKIAAALTNRMSKPFVENERNEAYSIHMLQRLHKNNGLCVAVFARGFQNIVRNGSYIELTTLEDIPALDIPDMQMISFGNYQIVQGHCYLSNQIHQHNEPLKVYQFFDEDVAKHCCDLYSAEVKPVLLMAKLKSRFVSRRLYSIFVLVDKTKTRHQSVLEYCCSCKIGTRTVGCCSHVMALIYYIGYAPHNGGVRPRSEHLNNLFDTEITEEESDIDAEDMEE